MKPFRAPSRLFPKKIEPGLKAFRFRPEFNSISPKNGAKYKTHIVLIRATYTDLNPKGTGINPSACRLYVDNENRSRAADIGKYGLHLQLKNVPNGDHTYEIELRDHAGNLKAIERKFVVAVPTPIPTHTPTTRPTYYPTVYPTVYPTHTSTPKPYTTPDADADAVRDDHPVSVHQPVDRGEPHRHRLAHPVAQRVGQSCRRGRQRRRG